MNGKVKNKEMAREACLCDLVLCLFDIRTIKFGEFTLKSGMLSPAYLELTSSGSYSWLLVCHLSWLRLR